MARITRNLSEAQRAEVIRRYRDDRISGNKLAIEFGVHPQVIYRVLYGASVFRRKKPFGEERICRLCGKSKALSEFAKCATRPDWNYHSYECRQCVSSQHSARGYSLKNNTGLTLNDYDRLLKSQGGHCALCPQLPNKTRLHVDHDHATMKIRGLLCSRCNRSMAAIDDCAWHDRALAYRLSDTGLVFKPSTAGILPS
jgi:hypothetical protein